MTLTLMTPPQENSPIAEAQIQARVTLEEAEEIYRRYEGPTRRPGLKHLWNFALASYAYSEIEEARQVESLKNAGAPEVTISERRRYIVLRREDSKKVLFFLKSINDDASIPELVESVAPPFEKRWNPATAQFEFIRCDSREEAYYRGYLDGVKEMEVKKS